MQERQLPGIYIIDADLKVLYHRQPDHYEERRARYRFDGTRLPHGIGPLVRSFWRRASGTDHKVESVLAADGSILLRMSWLHGSEGAAACVIFERFNKRDHVAAAVRRYNLSSREAHVLRLLFEGLSTNELADKLSISRSTTLFHIANLLAKTHSRNRSEMISKALT